MFRQDSVMVFAGKKTSATPVNTGLKNHLHACILFQNPSAKLQKIYDICKFI